MAPNAAQFLTVVSAADTPPQNGQDTGRVVLLNPDGSPFTSAAGKLAGTGLHVPSDWGAKYRAKLAGGGLTRVAVVGDSVAAGYYTSNPRARSWPARVAAALQSKFGDGGSGFNGSSASLAFASSAASIPAGAVTAYTAAGYYWAATGAWSQYSTPYGPGACVISTQAVGAKQVISGLRGTALTIYTLSGGFAPWSYQINGGAAVPIADGATFAIQATQVAAPTGTYSLTINYAGTGANSLYLIGIEARNAAGVVVDNFSKYGALSAGFADTSALGAAAWSGGPSNPADLLVYALAANDSQSTTATGITLTAAVAAGVNVLPVSAYVAPGQYLIGTELVYVFASTAASASLSAYTTAAHGTGSALVVPSVSAEGWLHNLSAFLSNARSVADGGPDLLVVMPHIGNYDSAFGNYSAMVAKALGVCHAYGAALVDMWAIGRNSWPYWNALAYWGNGATPGTAGGDVIHLSDAGADAYASAVSAVVGP
ncbi:hypothetical protein SAMN04515671_2906 [Nakamurella panacisegetis]|uniref:Uncharacterized protein n=1 Tax=Nakamurella panacisegetis TaxID=1090615 RepID=A0A1H0PU67_9ACTN|nr:hypothetical protein [Nakamurella panacisegetis]SDP08681.1 hypothetical protein SAMN04515671_2906 [Nakamurella panacisegetis]